MVNSEEIRSVIAQLRKNLAEERQEAHDIDSLIQKKIEREPGLWEFSYDELEKELFKRFSILEDKKDALLSPPDIASPRRIIGWLIKLVKKAILKITQPYSRMVLDRQDQFNRDLIPILLAAILSLQKIKDRLNASEFRIKELLESQEELSRTVSELSISSKEKVEKN